MQYLQQTWELKLNVKDVVTLIETRRISFLPNDRDFGHIELSQKKTQHIYVPQDWEQVVIQARQKKTFHVCKMTREDSVLLKPLKAAVVNRKISTVGGKVE